MRRPLLFNQLCIGVAWATYSLPVLFPKPNYCCGGGFCVFVPELVPLVPVPLEEPGEFAPLVPRSGVVDEPGEFAPVFVGVRSVSLVLDPVFVLLGRVVGSLVLVPGSRVRVLSVAVSLLSQPMNAMPPNAKAADNKSP